MIYLRIHSPQLFIKVQIVIYTRPKKLRIKKISRLLNLSCCFVKFFFVKDGEFDVYYRKKKKFFMLKIRSDFFFLDIPGVSRGTLTFTTIALKTQYTPVSLKSSSGTSFQKLTTPEV